MNQFGLNCDRLRGHKEWCEIARRLTSRNLLTQILEGHCRTLEMEGKMLARRFIEFLDTSHARYELMPHPVAYTAWQTAFLSHVPEDEVAKTVIVKIDGKLFMAVLPASRHVDLGALASATKARQVRLASESEFKRIFPDCEVGAMPPFGNLYGVPVLVDATLAKDKRIAFNACSHSELMRMSYEEFAELVKPKVLEFTAEGEHALYVDDRPW